MDMPQNQMATETEMEAAPEGDGSYTICIRVGGDGSLSVGVENEAEVVPSEGETDEYAGLKPAKDIKDALTQALAIYKADGQTTADSQFDQGFTGQGM